MSSRRQFLTIVAAVALPAMLALPGLIASPATAQTAAPVYTGIVKGVAVGGYDPVAYFTEKKPVKGNPAVSLEHAGAQYHFSNEANREAFKKEPAKYAPQFGGYCAWAVSQGYTAHGDPNAWTVSDGKLFLNYNAGVRSTWEKDIPGHIIKANTNWPKLVKK